MGDNTRGQRREVDIAKELQTKKNKQPILDWKPAMVVFVWKYSPPKE
jgi:hypothetical protein